jgi:hypothetical protein
MEVPLTGLDMDFHFDPDRDRVTASRVIWFQPLAEPLSRYSGLGKVNGAGVIPWQVEPGDCGCGSLDSTAGLGGGCDFIFG